MLGIETSLRLCEPVAGAPLEASRSVISTGRSADGCELDGGSRSVVLGPVVIDGVDVAIGRGVIAGAMPDYRE